MLNNNAAGSKVLGGVFFAVMFTVIGLSSCGGGGASPPPFTPPVSPTVTLSASPSSIATGTGTTLNWLSANSAGCTLSGGEFAGVSVPMTGSQLTSNLMTSTTYTLTCTGPGGTASQSTTVTIAAPAVTSFYATPSSIATGTNTTLYWSSANSIGCTLSGGEFAAGIPVIATGTQLTSNLAVNTTYTLTCTDGSTTSLASTFTVIVGCLSSETTPGAITLPAISSIPARTIGVAPLAVFFDATGTTATATARPFHDLEYRWDFGDPAGGATWNAGSRTGVSSRNTATGPVASHVYETPGTYTVAMDVTDGTDTVSNSCNQIVVQDPDIIFAGANTICVGATSTPVQGVGGCPAGANTAQQPNFATAINTYALTGKRVLFKRGDTFTEMASANAWLKVTGPGIIGAFGTNAEISAGIKPKMQMDFTGITYNVPYLTLGKSNTPGIEDWRIMDLEFDGQSQSKTQGTYPSGGFNKFTFLRMHMHHIYSGIMLDDEALDFINTPVNKGHTIFDQIAIIDSTITPYASPFGWRIYIAAKHLSIMGNTLGNVADSTSMASHIIRARYVGKGVISNNTLARSGSAMLAIKLHGPAWCDATSPVGTCLIGDGTVLATPTYNYLTNTQPIGVSGVTNGYTEQVIISDNEIIGAGSPYLVDIGPQNQFYDQRVRDVIVERNWFKEGVTQTAVVLSGIGITARNNICNLTGGTNQRYCFNAKRYSVVSPAEPPHTIWVYNNTAYSGDASGGSQSFALLRVEFDVTGIIARNNLAYAPLAAAGLYHLIDDSNVCGAACITASNNSTDDQVKNTIPGWVSPIPAVPADFSLTAGSYARDAGASGVSAAPVFSDFFLIPRPQSGVPGVIDMGAVEGP